MRPYGRHLTRPWLIGGSELFFWFVASAVMMVLFVFDSPAADYRFVAVGSVLPLVEDLTGRPLLLHTLLGPVALMALIMLVTRNRRILRRQLLGVPIGSFVFLVVAGVWTRTSLFWWPVAGVDAIARGPLPEFDRPVGLLVVMEAVGLAALVWLVFRLRLLDDENGKRLLQTGRFPREHLR